MTFEYTIISIDDSRAGNKQEIRNSLDWKEANIEFVDGKNPQELYAAKQKWTSIDTPGPFKAGEFGIFYSVLNCLDYAAHNDGLLYFEDDAIVQDNFQDRIENYLNELPSNADLFALWSPLNQQYDFDNVSNYNNVGEPIYEAHQGSIFNYGHNEMSRLWQGYGNVCMYFSRRGAEKLLKYITCKGFFSPIDCLICIATHGGYLNGYSLKPNITPLIEYNWERLTTIHNSAWGSFGDLTLSHKNDKIEELTREKNE